MRQTSKGLVFASVAACAGAMRSKVDLQSSGAVAVVDHIASLLGREHTEIRRLAEAFAAQATPGVSGEFTESLQEVVDKIEETLQPRVQEAHDSTQGKINKAFQLVQTASGLAGLHKAAADAKDKVWFDCVTQELEDKEFHETEQEHLEAAERAEQEAWALAQENKDFSFTADDYNFDFTCDHAVAGNCEEKMASFRSHLIEMTSDAEEQYASKKKYYDDLVAIGETKAVATEAARQAAANADASHRTQQNKCEGLKQARIQAICEYGDSVQYKGIDEAKFKEFVDVVEASGNNESEVDRQQEWTSLVTTSCMLKKSIELGTNGPVSETDVQACSAQASNVALAELNKHADEFKVLSESNPCVAGPISFFNGEEWTVSGAGDRSEDYSKQSFTPALNPTDGEQPFEVCPQLNQDYWRKVVLDEKGAAR